MTLFPDADIEAYQNWIN